MKVNYKLSEALTKYVAPKGYYVRMDRNYVATVRNLQEFINYIESNSIDMDVFGQIQEKDMSAHPEFKYALNEIIAEVKGGFKVFNGEFKHQFIQCTDDNETISIRTSAGKNITISVMEKHGCVDIKYFDSPQPKVLNGINEVEKFKVLGFDLGKTPIPKTDVTLFTILMNE